MRTSRLGCVCLAMILTGVIGPAITPFFVAALRPDNWQVFADYQRLASLGSTTAALALLVAALTIPVASVLALVSAGSHSFNTVRLTLLLGLATPLPVVAVAWHALRWGRWTPLDSGLVPAAIIHGVAGLPWVTLIISAGLRRVDRSVQDDALLHTSPFGRALRVQLPLAVPFVAMAGTWLIIQVASEIVVTDLLQVRTLAEEVYTQAVAPTAGLAESAEQALGRSILGAGLMPVATSLAAMMYAPKLTRLLPIESASAEPIRGSTWAVALALLAVGVPWCLLAVRLMGGNAPAIIIGVTSENSWLLTRSMGAAVITGLIVSVIAGATMLLVRSASWLTCWKGRAGLAAAIAFLAAVPGPVVGIGVRQEVDVLLGVEDYWGGGLFRSLLYEGPSAIPVILVWAARSLPLALVVWWPAVARLPKSFGETARLETQSQVAFARHEILPALSGAGFTAAGLVAVFCLGEVSGSRLAATPGGQMIAHDIFSRMHFGITPDLAGLCLLVLAAVAAVAMLASFVRSGRRRQPRRTVPTSLPLP